MTVYPNVKLNLGLSVLRRRPDGFHDIETLFVPCDAFRDVLTVELKNDCGEDLVELVGADWPVEKDLAYRALRLLREDFAFPALHIRLEKHSPSGAGLGGGSSDAAFTLRCINELCSLGLDESRLAGYASKLGADCAFFVYNRPMFGEGKGEILSEWPVDLRDFRVEVIVPDGVSVSTAAAYSLVVPRDKKPDLPSLKTVLGLPVEQWKGLLTNDFEDSVFRQFPAVAEVKESMYARGAVYAAMSGSGSAVFGLFRK